jgi:hypothetical protein
MGHIHALIGWLNLSDYDVEIANNSEQVVSRFARGNTVLQNGEGAFVDEAALAELSHAGDRAIREIDRLVPQLG